MCQCNLYHAGEGRLLAQVALAHEAVRQHAARLHRLHRLQAHAHVQGNYPHYHYPYHYIIIAKNRLIVTYKVIVYTLAILVIVIVGTNIFPELLLSTK